MADQVKKQLDAINASLAEISKNKDADRLGTMYTKGATLMANDLDPIVGRKNIVDTLLVLFETLNEVYWEKNVYYELVNDNTAVATDLFGSRNTEGKTTNLYHSTLLWKLEDGAWRIDRELLNSRPMPATPSSEAKQQIASRMATLYKAFNSEDYDAALKVYDTTATVVPHDADIVTGKQAIKEIFKEVIPPMKTLIIEEMYYFELLNDTKAYTNCHMRSEDADGKVKALFRDCMVWTRIDGEWYIVRDTFNDRPLPSQK